MRAHYEERVIGAAQRHTGASKVIFTSYMVRGAEAKGQVFPYATFTHADDGSEFEPFFRRMLQHRCGFSEAEAQSCGICAANLWVPAGGPAYKNPICLPDGSTPQDWEAETIRFSQRSDLHYDTRRPEAERVPRSARDAPAIGLLPHERHRWVYCPPLRNEYL